MLFVILIGKLFYLISRIFNFGSGGTWPGEIALFLKPDIFSYFCSRIKKGIIIIAGTNGKTTTSKMVGHIFAKAGIESSTVVRNETGANLLNGLISSFIKKSSFFGNFSADWAIFEVDENTLPNVISSFRSQNFNKQKIIIALLNLFRDQLDRYGEVDTIARKWEKALINLPNEAIVLLNADDPQIAYLGDKLKSEVYYFGIDNPKNFLTNEEHATDSTFCLNCNIKLNYRGIYFSHLGDWFCSSCGYKRPILHIKGYTSPLLGLYNEYNTQAAVGITSSIGLPLALIKKSLTTFRPAFGRQEEFTINGKKVKIFLSKNPAGFNASLRTIMELKAKTVLFVLNDRIPDGRDVSWIWDVDFEILPDTVVKIVSGDRAYDLGLRLKYAIKDRKSKKEIQTYNSKLKIYLSLKEAIFEGIKTLKQGETLYILPTYSAMLEARKIFLGRKIL